MKGDKNKRHRATAPGDSGHAAEWVPTASIIPWKGNPRQNDDNVARVAESIARFGWASPIVARRENGEVIAGHTRLKAAESLGIATVPVRFMDISEADAHLLALADNRLNELSPWDTPRLQELLSEYGLESAALAGWSSDDLEKMASELIGGGAGPEGDGPDGDNDYTRKIKAPIYEPKNECPPVSVLCDREKADKLLAAIDAAPIPGEVAAFLRHAAERHVRFNFRSIADFYAHAPPDTQRLMEASALVIVDFDAAIEHGFIKLSERLGELVGQEKAQALDDEDA